MAAWWATVGAWRAHKRRSGSRRRDRLWLLVPDGQHQRSPHWLWPCCTGGSTRVLLHDAGRLLLQSPTGTSAIKGAALLVFPEDSHAPGVIALGVEESSRPPRRRCCCGLEAAARRARPPARARDYRFSREAATIFDVDNPLGGCRNRTHAATRRTRPSRPLRSRGCAGACSIPASTGRRARRMR